MREKVNSVGDGNEYLQYFGGDGSGTTLSINISDTKLQHACTGLLGETVKVDAPAQEELIQSGKRLEGTMICLTP